MINKISIFCLFFLILYSGKNLLVSGCLIFPIEQTCIKKIFWYDKDSHRSSNAINARLENESWTKGWINQKKIKKNYNTYLKDFVWVKTWLHSEGKRIIKKLTPFIIFLSILLISLFIFERKNKTIKISKSKLSYEYYLCFIVSILGSLLWFLKFPLFRYGYGYLITLISFIFIFYIKNFKIFFNDELIIKSLKYLIIFLILGISLKNINRINFGIKNSTYIWPNIYNSNMGYKKKRKFKNYKK